MSEAMDSRAGIERPHDAMTGIMLENILNAAIGRILSVVTPKKVFLFGSAARGVMGVNSDIDLLVIVPSGVHRRKTAQNIYRNMIGVGFATDIVVVTEEDVERFINTDGMVIHPAVTGGRLIYGA